jgi:hypothetical protein
MAAVPVIINGVLMPKAKDAGSKPVPAVFYGYASIAGLEVGGGPIIPDHPVDPPIDPPVDPPSGGGVAVVIKPAPVTGGWGLASQSGGELTWFYVPSQSGAGPKK